MAERAAPLRRVLDQQRIPIRLLNGRHPDVYGLLIRWITAGVPVDGLAVHFNREWLVKVYGDWLLSQMIWILRHSTRYTVSEYMKLRSCLRSCTVYGCRLHFIDPMTKLPMVTYGRRALTEISIRFGVLDAIKRYWEANPGLREKLRGRPNDPKWERANPERDLATDWLVEIFPLQDDEERAMFGWRPGDSWRDLVLRRVEYLERRHEKANAVE